MRLTRHTDCALRLLVHLSLVPGHRASAVEVARSFGTSVDHLRKVAQDLASFGIVRTRRGRGGGVEMLADPTLLTVGEVVRLMEGPGELLQCMSDPDDGLTRVAGRLLQGLQEAQAALMMVLDKLTIAQCVDAPDLARQLLRLDVGPSDVVRWDADDTGAA